MVSAPQQRTPVGEDLPPVLLCPQGAQQGGKNDVDKPPPVRVRGRRPRSLHEGGHERTDVARCLATQLDQGGDRADVDVVSGEATHEGLVSAANGKRAPSISTQRRGAAPLTISWVPPEVLSQPRRRERHGTRATA